MSRPKKSEEVTFRERLRMLVISLIAYISFIALVTVVVVYLATELGKALGWL